MRKMLNSALILNPSTHLTYIGASDVYANSNAPNLVHSISLHSIFLLRQFPKTCTRRHISALRTRPSRPPTTSNLISRASVRAGSGAGAAALYADRLVGSWRRWGGGKGKGKGKGKGRREFYQLNKPTKTVRTEATRIHAQGWYGGASLFVHVVSVVPSFFFFPLFLFFFFFFVSHSPSFPLSLGRFPPKREVPTYRILTIARIAAVSRVPALRGGGEHHDDCAGGANRVDAIVLHAYVGSRGRRVAGAFGLLCGWTLEKGGCLVDGVWEW